MERVWRRERCQGCGRWRDRATMRRYYKDWQTGDYSRADGVGAHNLIGSASIGETGTLTDDGLISLGVDDRAVYKATSRFGTTVSLSNGCQTYHGQGWIRWGAYDLSAYSTLVFGVKIGVYEIIAASDAYQRVSDPSLIQFEEVSIGYCDNSDPNYLGGSNVVTKKSVTNTRKTSVYIWFTDTVQAIGSIPTTELSFSVYVKRPTADDKWWYAEPQLLANVTSPHDFDKVVIGAHTAETNKARKSVFILCPSCADELLTIDRRPRRIDNIENIPDDLVETELT